MLAWGSAALHAGGAGGAAEDNAAASGCWAGSRLLETCSSCNDMTTLHVELVAASSIH
jgi:hypothetical protein